MAMVNGLAKVVQVPLLLLTVALKYQIIRRNKSGFDKDLLQQDLPPPYFLPARLQTLFRLQFGIPGFGASRRRDINTNVARNAINQSPRFLPVLFPHNSLMQCSVACSTSSRYKSFLSLVPARAITRAGQQGLPGTRRIARIRPGRALLWPQPTASASRIIHTTQRLLRNGSSHHLYPCRY
uniref:Uncharacterized protein n=1 Tax=Candidatus Kentrum sp. MB TaxID=2138164 RepID=A0A451BAC6_9GAMM|nr:MAG: hypothetical protein BECKMB1821I_GA0114274_10182 [Candidatus Kentron sp. MB]VFK75223.1 MAG: hypothetical protein BECKMB1821H_GA0114242_10182 [Candidatus Kentron sp. MB]